MTQPDKLMLEEAQMIANNEDSLSDYPNLHTTEREEIAQQLADTMRENERLRRELNDVADKLQKRINKDDYEPLHTCFRGDY